MVVLEVQLQRFTNACNEQSVQIQKQQIIRYDKVEPLKLNRRAIHGQFLRLTQESAKIPRTRTEVVILRDKSSE